MLSDHYFYNCSKEYVESINQGLFSEINEVIGKLPKRNVQAEINADLFRLLTKYTWAYDSMPQGLADVSHADLTGSIDKVILSLLTSHDGVYLAANGGRIVLTTCQCQ